MVLTCLVVVPRLRRRWGDGWSSSTRSGPWKLSQSSDRSWWISPPHPAMDCSVKCPLLRSVVTNLGRKISPISIKFWIHFTVHSCWLQLWGPVFCLQLRERVALLKTAEKETEEQRRDDILAAKQVSSSRWMVTWPEAHNRSSFWSLVIWSGALKVS